ncbi:DUF2207 domain-containing protein [Bacillus wiedmannii]|uniref:DUF2207 domain-containing protein n=1 Tax=Bacillus wiedmannii TaxID=1890302 RepID=UPI000BF182B6|nr:DUF2207 domain-containing protein [Bacillus wiedmannii]PEI66786.1 DUF2207 domain-containing protein [Bacillus wiedmannii]PEP75669.1 DUF2207 domain-containing protein [Bacillus wiedmannii]PGA31290.1 DUF2207 domain-containing protein [Bacillus wiedmannii]PGC00323.1 DUF2207 domain-containing protein [Bacillus wiedmannii]PHC02069.1 DUF2207 domain-containing protein [Bacillus wiedmannii]
MAGRIKGITIEIGGNTQPLQNALKDVNKQSDALAKELKDVERLLKFDPGNVEALAQKQKLLTQQIENTTQKLDKLKAAEQQVQAQFQNGKISEEQYRAFRREIEFTEGSLNGLKNKLGNMKAEQENVASSTRQLETLFRATGKSVDDFAGALGNRLVNAIKSGTATSRQLEQVIGIIGREALGTEADIEKLQRALRSVDAGNSIQQVRNELRDLQQEAQRTQREFQELDIGLENVLGAMVAGGGIARTIEKAMDMSKLKTKIDISFDVPESSKKSVEEAIRGVTAYGVDAEESLAGVRRQWALNKDISDEANASIVKGAATIAQSYEGIDFTELIQETYEIGSELGITQESALGMVDALLKMGFPPEQLDIIAEYGSQLTRAGFKAEEVQAIMEAGVETGSWNIDNMLDGLKEGRIQLTEFAQGADKALKEALDGSGIATEQIEKWGAAVAKGGSDGSKAMVEVAKAIEGIEDPVKKNQVGVKVLATMFEDQGQNLTNTLINASEKTVDFQKNQDKLNGSIKKMDASPAVKFQKAMGDLQMALKPVLGVVADLVSKFAEWISNNPELAATLATIGVAIGVISGAIMALAPIVMTVMSFFEIGALAAAGLVAGIPLLIAALAAIGIAIYKNWDSIKQWTIDTWNSIKEYLIELWNGIVQSSSEAWNSFLETMHAFFDPIGQFFSDLWTGIGEICSSTWNFIVEFFSGAWASFTEMMHSFFDPIGEFFSSLWSGIVETASSWWTSLVTTASELWGTLVQAWQDTWNTIVTVLDPIISFIATVLEAGWLLIQAGTQIAWAAISQYIIQPIQEAYNWVSTTISEMVTWIGTQWEIAKAVAQVAWGLFKQYIIQPVVDTWNLVKEKFSDLVSWLNSQWETIKSYTSAAWNLVKQYVIQPVQELWNTTKQKLGYLANWILSNWERIKSYTLTAWNLVKQYVINPVTETYNQAKQKFTDLYNSAQEKFNAVKNAAQEKFDAAKRNIIDPIKEAVGKVEEFIGKIKGFFSDLKLKIPKPEMPKLPHFSLQTSTKNVLGKDVTFPSGIDVDWRAKGGIFTKPTIFGMNGGNLQGAGEAGKEAVLPLNRKTLGQIGEGIAATMVGTTGSMNQLMNDMSRMMASSMSQLSELKSVMSGVYGNMSNSRQAMIVNAAGAMSVPIINAGGPVPTSPQDMIVQVVVDQPVIVDGRTVQRVVKKENYREDNINFLKRGQ